MKTSCLLHLVNSIVVRQLFKSVVFSSSILNPGGVISVENIQNFTIMTPLLKGNQSLASEMDTALTQRPVVGRLAIILSSGLIKIVIACEMPQCINNQNKPDTAQQVPRGKHTLSLITAVSAGATAERGPLSFLFWAELQRAGGRAGRREGNGCTSLEAVYTSREAKQKKMHDFLRGRGLTQRLHLLISRVDRKATVTDCWIFVVFFTLWWSIIRAQ